MRDELIFSEDVVADIARRLSHASTSISDLQSQLRRIQNNMTYDARKAPINGSRADILVSEKVRVLGEYSQRISRMANKVETVRSRFVNAENNLAQVGQAKAAIGDNPSGTVPSWLAWLIDGKRGLDWRQILLYFPFGMASLIDGARGIDWRQLLLTFVGKAKSLGEATFVTPWKDYLWSFIGGFGSVGKTAKTVRDVITKWQSWYAKGNRWEQLEVDKIIKDTIKGGWSIYKSGKTLTKYAKKYKTYKRLVGEKAAKTYYAKKAFGLNKYWDGHDAAHRLSNKTKILSDGTKVANKLGNFKSNFGKIFKSEMSISEHADTYIFAAIGSFIDNLGDVKSGKIDSVDRFVVEWATETVTDVAVGAACSALAGAGLAALGVTAAPAVAVAAAGAAIGIGVNAICKWATKEFLGEEYNIAQAVGHVTGEAYDWAKKKAAQAADVAVDVASKAGKAIGDAASKAGKAAKNAGKAVCKWVKSWF